MESTQVPQTRILVIDDEVAMREGCRRALSSAGYSADTAADLTTGRRLALSGSYDLYLLDVMLPDGSGLDLLDPILDKDPNAICVIITGFGSIEMAIEAVRLGAYNFLSKPFSTDQLLVAVRQGLERRQLKAIELQAEQLTQAKAELEHLDQIKSQLMLKVAHELRAPVAAVQSYINLILADYIAGAEIKPTLTRVQERLQEMLDLVADLLELARLKQAKEQFTAEAGPQQMAELLEEVSDLLREQAHAKRQSLKLEIRDRPVIVADRKHLKQIWTNLISNAIKYTPEGGAISISLQADSNTLVGTVVDSGIGIAEADLSKLFQEFFRTDQAKASGAIGTGLGLSIVKQIVDTYGGQLQVTSKLGQGSRFTFTLPLEPLQAKPRPESPSAKAKSTRPPVLPTTHARAILLDDNPTPET